MKYKSYKKGQVVQLHNMRMMEIHTSYMVQSHLAERYYKEAKKAQSEAIKAVERFWSLACEELNVDPAVWGTLQFKYENSNHSITCLGPKEPETKNDVSLYIKQLELEVMQLRKAMADLTREKNDKR